MWLIKKERKEESKRFESAMPDAPPHCVTMTR
jgi:hypothetical protein